MRPVTSLRRLTSLTLLVLLLPALAAAEGPDRKYYGVLHVVHTCPLPQFQATAVMDVEVLVDGSVLIGDATMHYEGEEELGGCTYTRNGDWDIQPLGWYQPGPPAHVEIDENTQFSEHIRMECDPPVGVVIDEYPDGVYDGHLAFLWNEATADGATVSGTGDPDNDVVWTLTLLPGLPLEQPAWSTVKARYHK